MQCQEGPLRLHHAQHCATWVQMYALHKVNDTILHTVFRSKEHPKISPYGQRG